MHTVARALLLTFLSSGGAFAQAGAGAAAQERLAREFGRWSKFLASDGSGDELWTQIQGESRRVLALADDALRSGHPWLALQRIAPVALNLAGAEYLRQIPPAQRSDEAAFEAERTRMGGVLADALGDAKPAGLERLRPAAVRALAEIAWPQVREFYGASLEYAQSTEPRFGYFYVGQAKGARDIVALCRELAAVASPEPQREPQREPPTVPLGDPPLRPLAAEIGRLESELLAAYRPPPALLLHGEFITASSLLKEARELDAAGLRAGALLRYLQAALQSSTLRPRPKPLDAEALAQTLRDQEKRLTAGGVDGSIGRVFLDSAEAARTGAGASPGSAMAIATDVLPRYFAALEPAAIAPEPPPPRATVTLVRWPFT